MEDRLTGTKRRLNHETPSNAILEHLKAMLEEIMPTPRFDTLEEAQAYVASFKDKQCHPHPIFLLGVEITEAFVEMAKVARPGWYLCRRDLRRFLPLDHIIVRRGLDEPTEHPPLNPEFFAGTDA